MSRAVDQERGRYVQIKNMKLYYIFLSVSALVGIQQVCCEYPSMEWFLFQSLSVDVITSIPAIFCFPLYLIWTGYLESKLVLIGQLSE